MAKQSLYDSFLNASKVLNLRAGDLTRGKKALDASLVECAITDGVALYKREKDFSADIYAHSVGLSRTRTSVSEMIDDLAGLTRHLGSKGCPVLSENLQNARAVDVEGVKETITRYAKLAQSVCAHSHWFKNYLENPHARKMLKTEEQFECARQMCKLIGVTFTEPG